ARSSVRAGVHRKPDDLCAGSQSRLSRHADPPPHRPRREGRQLSIQVHRPRHCLERCVPQERSRARCRARAGEAAGQQRVREAHFNQHRRSAVMSFLSGKHLSRRTVLKGAGATIALPLLDAMIPAGTAFAQTLASSTTRLGFVYFPHGALQDQWQPTKTGRDFDFPFIIQPLEPFREYVTVVSGLRNKGGESSSPHGIIEETWLNCVSPP